MSDHDMDAVELLRRERPDASTDPSLSHERMPRRATRPTQRRRRTAMRVGAATAVVTAVVLGGVQFVTGSGDSHRPTVRGISTAEAKQLAVTALQGVSKLTNYRMVQSWTTTEVGGAERVVSHSTVVTAVDGNRAGYNVNRNDFVGLDARGAEYRRIGGRTYVESGTPRIEQGWMLNIRPGGNMVGWAWPVPQTAGIIEQLQREGLIDARRTTSGSIVVEVRRPARALADADGMGRGLGGGDPITGFATGIAMGEHADTEVTARLTISGNGKLRSIRVSARYPAVIPNGRGGVELLSDVVSETKLSPASKPIVAPDPADVMVVGDVLRTRKGATGADGPHGTLDTFTPASLRALAAKIRTVRDTTGIIARRPARPARDYSKLMRLIQQRRQLMLTELATMERDPAALATDSRCTPFWPSSGRVMDIEIGRERPARAGWKCRLRTVDAHVSTEPGSPGWSWAFVDPGGGGCCLTEAHIARATK